MAQWRLCGSSYRGYPQEASLHTQYHIHISSPSTTDNEGGGWLATGPIGWESGIDFTDYVEADNRQQRAVNRGLIADEYIFFLQGDRLWRTRYTGTHIFIPNEWGDDSPDPGEIDGYVGNPWSAVHTFSNVENGRTGRNTGIYHTTVKHTEDECKRYIIGAYNSTVAGANTWKGFRYDIASGVVSETSSIDLGFPATPSQGGVKAEILHDGKLYFIGTTDGGIGVYNPSSNTMGRILWPTTDIRGPHDFCIFNNSLYCLNSAEFGDSGGSGIYIWRVDGAVPQLALNLATNGFRTSSFTSEQYEGRCVLFTDNTYLYAGTMCNNGSSDATRFFRMIAGPTGTLILDGMNPSITYGPEGTSWTVRLNAFADQNTNPDGKPNITLNVDLAGVTGVLRHQWVWQGPTSAAFEEDSTQGKNLHDLRETARSHVKNGGGERIFVPPYGGPRAEIVNFSHGTEDGRVLLTYRIFNNPYDFPAGTPCTIQLRYHPSGHMPFHRGILAESSVGTLSENNTVIQIPASASGTDYTFEWDFRSNGLSNTQKANVAILISTTGIP